MKKYIEKVRKMIRGNRRRLDPQNPEERLRLIDEAVDRAVKEYGEALRKLGHE